MAKREEIVGELTRINQVFNAPPNETIIATLDDGTTVKGKASPDELEYGLTYLFIGNWTKHEKYGLQFHFYSVGLHQPKGQRGTVAYLQRGPGIGRQRAMQLWELYQDKALEMLRTKPDEVALVVNGLTAVRAHEAAAYFQAHIDREIVTRDLEELLSGGGFPKKLIEKLIEKWGARAAEVVRGNCYVLMIFGGVGFGKADKLYLNRGGDPTNPERLGWCAQHALASDREGNTWMRPITAIKAIEKSVAGVTVDAAQGIKWALDNGHVVSRMDDNGNQWIAEASRAAAEARLANEVWRAMAEGVGA